MHGEHTQANRLAQASSPYLLQHAFNPVDWYEWGPEALGRARAEDRPILVSIGYSSCHWCHVMERESFESVEIARAMNERFVCIKVDREERPDVDQVYMEAIQAMGLRGGWPLNVFLTPDAKPFYGGTYFPPERWVDLILRIAEVFVQRRAEVDESAENLRRRLVDDLAAPPSPAAPGIPQTAKITALVEAVAGRVDPVWGGLGGAPQFMMPSIWELFLRAHALGAGGAVLDKLHLTLRRMSMGGLYDQAGGGFCRYSVDERWFAPHFEKMLYDNAQLLGLYSQAYAQSKVEDYRTVVYETAGWLGREMTHPEGGFFSALDADSEGEEGLFYVWSASEIAELFDSEAGKVMEYYSMTEAGNWENGRNILFVGKTDAAWAAERGLSQKAFQEWKQDMRKRFLERRARRVRPSCDDKILAGWNALAICGLLEAYKAMGDPYFMDLARAAMDFLESRLLADGRLYRSHRYRRGAAEGFLEDQAFLIRAYTELYQTTFEESWLHKAEARCLFVLEHFSDAADGYFHFTSDEAEPLIARPKDLSDNVIPSSNAVMAENLLHLGLLLDRPEWQLRSRAMVAGLHSALFRQPSAFSYWARVYAEQAFGMSEIVIIGPECLKKRLELAREHLPFALFAGAASVGSLPLLKDKKPQDGQTLIYICHNMTCLRPVEEVREALNALRG